MSDYFPNNNRYGQNYFTNFGRHIEQTRNDFNRSFNEYEKREYYNRYNQSNQDLLRFSMLSREGQEFQERTEADNVEKFERLSSNLVQLLSTARQNTDQTYNPPGIVYIPPNGNLWTDIDPHRFRNRLPCSQTFTTHDVNNADVEHIRKEKHNKGERRRRSIINDRITELRNLLPEDISRATLGRKSKVLEEAIDYIRKLRKNIEQVQQLEDQLDTICRNINIMSRKLDKLEVQTETVSAKDKYDDIKTFISLENPVVTKNIKLSNEFYGGENMSIHDLNLPQDTLYADTTPSFDLPDVFDETRTPLSVDTTASLQSSIGLDFDDLSYIV